MPPHDANVTEFETYRPRLGSLAYRMLGSASDAEDIVQEAYIRWSKTDRGNVREPGAWLTTVVTNLCINELNSARHRREQYVGTWLPEPVLDGHPMLGPEEDVAQRESVTFAVLVLLEQLSPKERAAFVLYEAFSYPHKEIAEILYTSEAASQQLVRRARGHVGQSVTLDDHVRSAQAQRLLEEFLDAATTGNLDQLISLMTSDVTTSGDGGGQVPATPYPVHGATAVAKLLRGLFRPSEAKRRLAGGSPRLHFSRANRTPTLIAEVDGSIVATMQVTIVDGKIAALRTVANPDKLRFITAQWSRAPHPDPGYPMW
ncbi:RNA polymerase sigma factor SigJ [Haloglycomyces albus]|uniref:RNA polymerase sigma factor SigJ n=1 Tax=Haloglycomyces albus TaxID=526067 RepID=UPI00046D7B04|nr:RNA polymerase sigma factor SigJ [Haloglycomyces albus]